MATGTHLKKTVDPYITINKLAEYMMANTMRRRQIIKNLKEDADFKKLYYSEVKRIILPYFKSGYDPRKIDRSIKSIEAKIADTSWKHDADNPNSIMALKCLKETELPDLTDYEIVDDIDKIDNIELGGLKVTIKPDVYLKNSYSKKIGLVKIHIAKTEKNRLCLTGMQYAATLLKYSLLEYGFTDKEVDSNACISFDIFEKNFGTAPKAYIRHISAMEAACEEILARWPTL